GKGVDQGLAGALRPVAADEAGDFEVTVRRSRGDARKVGVGTGLLYRVQFSQTARDWRRRNHIGRLAETWTDFGLRKSGRAGTHIRVPWVPGRWGWSARRGRHEGVRCRRR